MQQEIEELIEAAEQAVDTQTETETHISLCLLKFTLLLNRNPEPYELMLLGSMYAMGMKHPRHLRVLQLAGLMAGIIEDS